MANVLGTILVDLQANVAGFVSGMSKAAVEAQKATREIGERFRELGEIAAQTFGPFGEELNPIISKLSFVLSSAGSAASATMKEFGKVGGALGPLASLGAGAAIGMAALSATLVGVAMHSAEAAEKLLQLSRSTGVPVEQLSALAFAARQTGIEQDQLVKSLQLLSTNMVKAAEAPRGASTAFSRLGLDIRQQNGDLKNAASFMGEVIAKLAEMRDQTAAVGIARKTMGRGGAAILQLGDPEEIEHWIEMAQKLGVVIDTKTAVAAEHFEQTLGLLRGAAEGTANRLMADLLPALQAVASELAKASEDTPNSFGKDLLKVIEGAIKGIIAVGQTWISAFETAGAYIRRFGANILEVIELAKSAGPLIADALSGNITAAVVDFGQAKTAWHDFLANTKANTQLFSDDVKTIWKDNAEFIKKVYGNIPDAPQKPRGGPSGLPSAAAGPGIGGRPDIVAELVAKLQAQATAELALASATEKSVSATILAKAAAEAEAKVSETRAHLLEREKELRERLASEPDSKHAPTLQAEIADVQKMLAELEKSAPQIKALYTEIGSASFAAKSSQELDKFITKTDEETTALRSMAAAYAEGPEAAQRAQQNAKIAPFEKQHADLGELVTGLRSVGAPEADVAKLQASYDQLGAAIDRAKTSVAAFTAAEISEKIAKENEQLAAEAKAYNVIAQAALSSASAQREAAARAASIKFGAEHPTATAEQLDQVYAAAIQKGEQQRTETIAQASAQYSLNASYSQELEKLQEIRSFLQSAGESTIAIDTKIYQTRIQQTLDYQKQVFESQNQQLLGEQKIYDLSVRQTEEWDRAANEVGTIGQKFRAMINEVELAGQNLGGKVFASIGKAFDDLSTQLARFIVTGKNGFREMIDSWAESLLKLSFQKTFSAVLGKIFGGPGQQGQNGQPGQPGQPGQNAPWSEAIPGLSKGGGPIGGLASSIGAIFGVKIPGAGGPDGSASRPFYVVMASSGEAPGATSTGNPASALGGLGSLPLVGPAFKETQSLIAPLSGLFGGGGSSGTGAPDGSQSNPFYVMSADSTGSSGAGGLSSLFSSFGGDSGGGDGGGGLGGLTDILAGFFMADGGRVSSGTPYVVGEKHPEVFIPDQAGRIVPSLKEFGNMPEARAMKGSGPGLRGIPRRELGGPVTAGMPYLTGESRPEVFVPDRAPGRSAEGSDGGFHSVINFNVTTRDYDSFRKSPGQIHADLQHQIAIAHERNRS